MVKICRVIRTRRPASADRTARRQFQASGHRSDTLLSLRLTLTITRDIYLPPPRSIVVVVCLSVCLSVCLLATFCKKLRTDWHEILRESWPWATNEQVVKFLWRTFWWRTGSPSGYRDRCTDSSLMADTESG